MTEQTRQHPVSRGVEQAEGQTRQYWTPMRNLADCAISFAVSLEGKLNDVDERLRGQLENVARQCIDSENELYVKGVPDPAQLRRAYDEAVGLLGEIAREFRECDKLAAQEDHGTNRQLHQKLGVFYAVAHRLNRIDALLSNTHPTPTEGMREALEVMVEVFQPSSEPSERGYIENAAHEKARQALATPQPTNQDEAREVVKGLLSCSLPNDVSGQRMVERAREFLAATPQPQDDKLREIVERLRSKQSLADGAIVTNGDPAYHPSTPGVRHYVRLSGSVVTGSNEYVGSLRECYSTEQAAREAALAAQQEGGK